LIGAIVTSYAAGYENSERYQTREYVIESLVSFGLILVACLIVFQGVYLIFLAATDRRSEVVSVTAAIVVPELKFRNASVDEAQER
jgi:hypothetical protein